MELEVRDFRHAQAILANGREWQELGSVAKAITARDVTETHAKLNAAKRAAGKKLIAGGRSALNALFREALEPMPLAWETEPRLFASDDRDMRGWKMDFLKNRVGVEISFNHAEAIPWTFTRLNIAGESTAVLADHQIDVGVAFFATDALKRWARMDSAVGTFEAAWLWLQLMKPLMPIPVLVVGLRPEDGSRTWASSDAFRGTRKA